MESTTCLEPSCLLPCGTALELHCLGTSVSISCKIWSGLSVLVYVRTSKTTMKMTYSTTGKLWVNESCHLIGGNQDDENTKVLESHSSWV
jgi:hypothetical protein